MNYGFEETGSTVVVFDENKNERYVDNRANIEAILILENDRAKLENSISKLEKENENEKVGSGNVVKNYIKHHHSFFSAAGAVAIAAFTGKTILPLFNHDFYLETGPLSLFGIVSTIALLHTKSVGYYNWKKEHDKIEQENNKTNIKLKNVNLLKFAINRELKVERNAQLPANRKAEYKDISRKKLVDFNILYDYEKNHDQLIKYFKDNGEVPYYEDQLYGRLISDMVQKELHDEKKAQDKSVVELAKDKVKRYLR